VTGTDEFVVDFPTLWIVPSWIEAHCVIPDGFRKGQSFEMYDWQLWCTVNHYRVRPDAKQAPDPDNPIRAAAFRNRRSQVVAPQKTGKGPWSAAIICGEAVGPVLFLDWASGGEEYRCSEHGCDCGWSYVYAPGEPMGRPWPTPLIQLMATSEDQVDNVYRPLQSMIRSGPLAEQMKIRESFIRLPNDGRIDPVTSSAMSRLGNPTTFALQDETGLYTKSNKLHAVADTMRRSLAGMSGRAMETTNCWDPAENSTAQQTYESRMTDLFKFYRKPPADLSYRNKVERRRIHRFNYDGSSHVELDSIEAEAAEMMERDPGQAERFFGNRLVAGLNAYLDEDRIARWEAREVLRAAPTSGPVCLAFDGSDSDDWSSIRAETMDGWQFTPLVGPDARPSVWNPAEFGGRIPRGEVDAAVDELFGRFDVVRMYCDPPDWSTEVENWALRYGEAVVAWPTYRVTQMHAVLERFLTDLSTGRLTHDGCPIAATHLQNARKIAKAGQKYLLGKPTQHQKIDHAMTSTLVHEAVCDALAAGWTDVPQDRRVIVFR
jgi:hypothetical protein